MKKYLLLLGVSVLAFNAYADCGENEVLGTVSGNCIPASGSCGSGCTYTISGTGHLAVSGTGNGNINNGVFKNNKDIITAEIGKGIKNISAKQFLGVSSMESIDIAEGVKSISYYEFQNCSSLKSLKLPESVTSLDTRGLCLNCSSLTELYVPDHAFTYFGENMIRGTQLSEFQLPDTVTAVSRDSVIEFNSISYSLVLPESVIVVGGNPGILSPTSKAKLFCTEVQIENGICATSAYKYEKDGAQYMVYNPDGSLFGVYENYAAIAHDDIVDFYEKYDEATGMHKKYDGRGNFVNQYAQNADGSTYIYDENGKLKTIRGKKIYTVEEAEAVTANGDKFNVKLTYK